MVSECVESKAACCVFFNNCLPRGGLKTSPFKMFQLRLESNFNKIALLTTAAAMARLVIICLTRVSGAGTGRHVAPRGGEIVLVTSLHLVSPWGEGMRMRTGVRAFRKEPVRISDPFAFPTIYY